MMPPTMAGMGALFFLQMLGVVTEAVSPEMAMPDESVR